MSKRQHILTVQEVVIVQLWLFNKTCFELISVHT